MCRPYGSAAEDLKCIEPDDLGDVDIVIFPNSDNLLIHDEMIEYLPENPMHVRIKGAHHPVLKSCLVEDTEYVATAALKKFHPVIYGSSAFSLINFLGRATELMSRNEVSSFQRSYYHLKNNTTSPAVTVNVEKSFATALEDVEMLKDPQNVANLDPTSWEWFAHRFCTAREIDLARVYTEVANELSDFVNDLEMSLNEQGANIVPGIFRELFERTSWYGDLKTRISEIENPSQPGGEIIMENWSDEELVDNQRPDVAHRNKRGKEECSQNSDDIQRFAEDWTSISSESTTRNPPENSDQFPAEKRIGMRVTEMGKDLNNRSEKTRDGQSAEQENPNDSKADEQHFATKERVISKRQQHNTNGSQEDEAIIQKEMFIRDRFSRHTTEIVKDSLQDTQFKDPRKAKLHKVVCGIDYVPALKSLDWPEVALEWIKRQRKWPPHFIVDRVIQEGFHLVVKPPKNGGSCECDFRLSFANAEYLLSQEMNEIQRECYRGLKKYHRAYLSTEPKSLVTFHLKNILLQTIEETGTEMWTESNRAECMMKLLANLMGALRKKDLRHFFVRSYNLFCADYIESPEILRLLADKVEQIMDNPMRFTKMLIQTNTDRDKRQIKKEQCVPSKKLTPSAEPKTAWKKQSYGQVKKPPTIGSDNTQRKQMEVTRQSHGLMTSYRYHDLKESFLNISKELTDIAFEEDESNRPIASLDAQERSLVDDLREMKRNFNIQVDQFPKMFDSGWLVVSCKVWFSNEPSMRRRVLLGIRGVIELYKYLLKQDDFAAGNADALISRLLNHTVEDPFDVSHIVPVGAGKQLACRTYYKLESRQTQKPQRFDDIPLD